MAQQDYIFVFILANSSVNNFEMCRGSDADVEAVMWAIDASIAICAKQTRVEVVVAATTCLFLRITDAIALMGTREEIVTSQMLVPGHHASTMASAHQEME